MSNLERKEYVPNYTLREMTKEDVEEVVKFWKLNYKITNRETPERLLIFLDKNRGLSTIAEKDGKKIAVALGYFTGRKGGVEMVAVDKKHRGNGIGREIVMYTVEKLLDVGALDIRLFCEPDLVVFYEKCGFELVEDDYIQMRIKKYR